MDRLVHLSGTIGIPSTVPEIGVKRETETLTMTRVMKSYCPFERHAGTIGTIVSEVCRGNGGKKAKSHAIPTCFHGDYIDATGLKGGFGRLVVLRSGRFKTPSREAIAWPSGVAWARGGGENPPRRPRESWRISPAGGPQKARPRTTHINRIPRYSGRQPASSRVGGLIKTFRPGPGFEIEKGQWRRATPRPFLLACGEVRR